MRDHKIYVNTPRGYNEGKSVRRPDYFNCGQDAFKRFRLAQKQVMYTFLVRVGFDYLYDDIALQFVLRINNMVLESNEL